MSPAVIRQADHHHGGDGRAPGEHGLDLVRVEVLPARVDHVVDPAADPQVAVVVLGGQVAGEVPAVADRAGVGVRAVPVAGERLRAGHRHRDLALRSPRDHGRGVERVDQADPGEHARAAGAAGLCPGVRADGERVDLGGAEVVDEYLGMQRVVQFVGQGRRHRGAGVGDARDGWPRLGPGGRSAAATSRWSAPGRARRSCRRGDQLEGFLGVEPGLRDPGARDQDAGQQGAHAHGVEQRHHAERHLTGTVLGLDDVGDGGGVLGPVGARDALRAAGGARGVEDDAEVFWFRAGVAASSPSGSRWASSSSSSRAVTGGPPVRAAGEAGRRGVVADDQGGFGVADAVSELGRAEPDRQRDGGGAQLLYRQVQAGHRLAAGQQERHPVAGPDALAGQRPGQLVRAGVPLPVGQRPGAADREPARVPVRGPGEHPADVHDDPVRTSRLVS